MRTITYDSKIRCGAVKRNKWFTGIANRRGGSIGAFESWVQLRTRSRLRERNPTSAEGGKLLTASWIPPPSHDARGSQPREGGEESYLLSFLAAPLSPAAAWLKRFDLGGGPLRSTVRPAALLQAGRRAVGRRIEYTCVTLSALLTMLANGP